MGLRIASVNVNGIRAACRTDKPRPTLLDWMSAASPDVVTIQEARADSDTIAALLGPGWHVVSNVGSAKGRNGVVVASRTPVEAGALDANMPRFEGSGRWIEGTVATDLGPLTAISAYVHTGDAADDVRMEEKLAFMDAMVDRLRDLVADDPEAMVLLTGDLNVAHREVDIKNWKGNRGKAGFLESERARFDRLFDEHGYVDLGRALGGPGPGPYSWWSYRGQAFDTDAGWRIDYQIASPALAQRATSCEVHRAEAYELRWSDHAPVVCDYELSLL